MNEPTSNSLDIVVYESHTTNSKVTSFGSFLIRTFHELYTFRFAYQNFVVNGIRVRYRRSKLGFLWTLLNPLLTMSVISIVFSYVFKQDVKEFAIFLFSGLTPFTFLSNSIMGCTTSLVSAESFFKKIYIPKVLFPLISVSIEAVNFSLSISALYILALILGAKLSWSILLLPFVLVIMFIFSLGIGLILSLTYVYFRDIAHFVQVGLTALFYITPIMYPENAIPDQLRKIFSYNPFSYFVVLARKVILGTSFTIIDWIIPLAISLVILMGGLLLMKKLEKRIIFRL